MVSEEEIIRIANLAKLNLNHDDIKKFSIQLSAILSYVKKFDEVDTSNVQPTSHPIDGIKNRFQEDSPSRTLAVSDILKNAKIAKENYVATKGIFK
ncbi:hypothetical protein A2713_00450 [candidate division WWE3 bacterium RIFCSPHIGHO2_01_FULL_35_17]|uniref:Aspartyl/glutamyl-tRNA(Asn/Gln) amidotransferase subunit C n=1 Tax=candidate division WWE3 bacterium RIFCSPHIGHO2_01_FULL_35_17 TaxID=1802614 RepID=A0A1F4UPW3_UNCKA|nr:MAG: hypothetical protein A2713_00450 [candidate division WWE3 bacterium RIFCSPHIGHO2_01_FULL_35_17]